MSQMKFLDDVDLGLCELQNHLLHIVGSAQTTQAQIYFNTGSSLNQMEYYDGTVTQVPITGIRLVDDGGSSQSIVGSRQAQLSFSGSGISVDASSVAGQVSFDNEHTTLQSMTDLATTPGSSNDGYAILWDNGTSSFKLVDLATVTTSGSFVTTNTNQTVGGQKTFSDPTFFQDSSEFQDDVVINGNLTVSGNHIMTQPETVVIEDNLFVLNSNHTGTPTEDAGILVNRGTDTNTAFVWDESADSWVFIKTTDDGTGSTPSVDDYANIRAEDATLSGLTVSNSTSISNLDISGLVSISSISSHTISSDTQFVIRDDGTSELEVLSLTDLKTELETKVTGTITGNGTLTSFTFTHSIGSLAVDVTLIEDSTGDKVFTTTRNISTTQSQISFKYPVAASKTYTVIAQ